MRRIGIALAMMAACVVAAYAAGIPGGHEAFLYWWNGTAWTPAQSSAPIPVSGTLSLAGTTSNASSGVATSATNVPTVSYNYGFNGATWDQLQVDAFKNLKVAVPLGIGAVSTAYSASSAGSVTTTATVVPTPGGKSTNICNATAGGGGTLWLELSGGTASIGQGIPVAPQGCALLGPLTNANGNIITGVSGSGTVSYTVTLGN